MKKKERDRVQVVAYEAYMAGQARGERTEEILDQLGRRFGVCSRTIQNWIYDVGERREAIQQELRETVRTNIMQVRHELGLPLTYHYIEDGHSVMEF